MAWLCRPYLPTSSAGVRWPAILVAFKIGGAPAGSTPVSASSA